MSLALPTLSTDYATIVESQTLMTINARRDRSRGAEKEENQRCCEPIEG